MRRKRIETIGNESGIALVVALIMIIVLTVAVLAASLTSIFEIKLSGNKRGSTDAFFAADSGVNVAAADYTNFILPGSFDTTNWKYVYPKDGSKPNPTKADITINHDPTRFKCPEELHLGLNFECFHFMIESTGQDQFEFALNKSTVTLNEKVVLPYSIE